MNENDILKDLKKAIVDGILEDTIELTNTALKEQIEYKKILNHAIIQGSEEIGKLYEQGEYFLADMLLAGDALFECMKIIKPIINKNTHETNRKILIGTPEGDLHDLGKNLIISLLIGQGFEVIDLGVDVPSEKFLEAAKNENPDVIGLSGLLTFTISKMVEIVSLLRREGITSKIILGGGILSEESCKRIGADDWTKDGWEGVKKIKALMEDL